MSPKTTNRRATDRPRSQLPTKVKRLPAGKTVTFTSDELRVMTKDQLFGILLSLGMSVDGLKNRNGALSRIISSAVGIKNI